MGPRPKELLNMLSNSAHFYRAKARLSGRPSAVHEQFADLARLSLWVVEARLRRPASALVRHAGMGRTVPVGGPCA